jgi:hypothetical protein
MARKSGGEKLSKAEALRKSLETNGWNVSNDVHQHWVREHHGLEMTGQQIATYKSNERRKSGRRRRRRKAGAGADGGAGPGPGRGGPRSDTVLQFVSTVRKWENKLGSKKVLAVIEALYKK